MNTSARSDIDLHAAAPAWLCRVRRFLRSPLFPIFLLVLFSLFTAQHVYLRAWGREGIAYTVAAAFVGVFVIFLMLLLCDDVFTTTVPFLLLTVVLSAAYDSYSVFIGYIWLIPVLVAALVFHFVYYRGHYHLGQHFRPLLAVSLAVTLGGLGTITVGEYFNPVTAYYVLGLGLGMLGLYCLLGAQRARKREWDLRAMLLFGLYLAALYAVFFTLCFYAVRWRWMVDDLRIFGHIRLISIDQRNVYATFLLLGLPAPFYYAQKGRWWHYGGALLIFLSLLLTGSRGGMLMGVLTLIPCCVYALRRDKRHRVLLLAALGVCVTGLLVAIPFLIKFFSFRFEGGFIKGDEPRVLLLGRAWGDFLSNPIFGTGIGYTGNADIYDPKKFAMNWYHMMIPQVVSGLGLCGVAAYGYMLFARFRTIRQKSDALSRGLALSYVSLLLMSQVNPGEFCPMPYELIAVMIFLFLEEPTAPAPLLDDTEQTALGLLRAAFFDRDLRVSPDTDFAAVLELAERHMIFGTASEGLAKLPEDAVPLPTLLAWQGQTVTLLRQNAALAALEQELFDHLKKEGIPAVVLKGSSVARLYPSPELRVQGDIDCLVKDEDISRVSDYLQGLGFERHKGESDHQIVFARDIQKIELHFAVSGIPQGEVGDKLRAALSDIVDAAVPQDVGGYFVPCATPYHQAIVLLLHMQQHMREGGLGLRQVGDFALFLGKELDAESTERLLPLLAECGLLRFAKQMAALSVRYLGLDAVRVPWAADADPVLVDALLADCIAAGNFGHDAAEYAGSAVVTKERGKGGSALTVAVRNVADKCRARWPITQKCGFLLVFLVPFWVIRRILRPHDGRQIRPVQMLRSAGKRGKLYDSLALFEPEKRS